MPTPIRNNKVGLPDPQGNGGHPTVATTEPSAMVRQMAAQNFALKNGGQMPPVMQGAPNSDIPPVATVAPMNVFAGGNQIIGKYSVPAKPQQDSTSTPTIDFTNMPKQSEFIPEGNGFANPEVGPVASPYMKDAAETTPQNVTNFEQIPTQKQATGWNPNGTARYDSLSAALNGMASQPRQPQFQADPTQKDGGFFNWVRSLTPKKRPGRHEGETDDEYDARHTRNMQMVATLADAIRHMGNIVNTSKGAPLQIFNDPNSMIEQGRQARKAERQKQAKLDADAALKQAEMTLKERAAEADRAYKQFNMDMQQNKFNYQKGRDDMADKKWQAKFEFDAAKDDRDFQYKQMRDKVKDGQWQAGYGIKVANLNLSRARFAHTLAKDAKGGSGGSGYAYATPYGSLYSKKQLSAQQENQMWNFMVINGQITKKKQKEYELAAKGDGGIGLYGTDKGSTSRSRRIMQECIAYGLMDATEKGDNFRKFCTNQLGMGEDRVYNTPQNSTTWKKGSVKQGQTGKWSIK